MHAGTTSRRSSAWNAKPSGRRPKQVDSATLGSSVSVSQQCLIQTPHPCPGRLHPPPCHHLVLGSKESVVESLSKARCFPFVSFVPSNTATPANVCFQSTWVPSAGAISRKTLHHGDLFTFVAAMQLCSCEYYVVTHPYMW